MAKDFRIQIVIGAKDEASKTFAITNKNLKQLSTNLSSMGRKAALAGTAMAAGLGLTIKKAGDFQEQMSFVSTMLGDQSDKFMPSYETAMKNMSKTFGQTTKTLSKGMFDILSASIPAEKAIGVLAASTKAAEAGFVETAITADAFTTVINAYSLAAEDAGDVSDWFFSIIEKGKTTMAELAPVIGLALPLTKQLGVSLEEVGASLTVMTRAGINTNIAVTSLRSIMGAFLKPTKELAREVRSWGFESSQAAIKSLGLEGVIKKLNKVSAERLPKLIEEKRALTGLLTLLDKQNEFIEDKITITNRAGKTDELFAKRQEDLNTQLRQLRETFNVLMVDIGTKFLPEAKKLIKFLKESSDGIAEFVKENGELVLKVGLLVPALTLMAGGLLSVAAAGVTVGAALLPHAALIAGITVALAPYAVALALVVIKMRPLVDMIIEWAGSIKNLNEQNDSFLENQKKVTEKFQEEGEELFKLRLMRATLMQGRAVDHTDAIEKIDIRIAKLTAAAAKEKLVAEKLATDRKKLLDSVDEKDKKLTEVQLLRKRLAQQQLLTLTGNFFAALLESGVQSAGAETAEGKKLAKAKVLLQQAVAVANIWSNAAAGGPLAPIIAAASTALIIPTIKAQFAAIDSVGLEKGGLISAPANLGNINVGEGFKKEVMQVTPLTGALPSSAISIQNINIHFHNVNSLQDFLDLSPSVLKEFVRRKLLDAVNDLAREGIFFPTRS